MNDSPTPAALGKSTQESFQDNVNSALLPPVGHGQSASRMGETKQTPDKNINAGSVGSTGRNEKHGH